MTEESNSSSIINGGGVDQCDSTDFNAMDDDDQLPDVAAASAAVKNKEQTTEEGADDDAATTPTTPAPTVVNIDEDLTSQLNIALESLETMRRANLEVEYSSFNTPLPQSLAVNHNMCTYCQREKWRQYILNPTAFTSSSSSHHQNCNGGSVNGNNNNSNNGGGGINIGSIKLDGSRLKSLDGSRIRRFGSNVGGLFAASKSTEEQQRNNDAVRKEDDELFARPNNDTAIGVDVASSKEGDDDTKERDDVTTIDGGSIHSSISEGENSPTKSTSTTTPRKNNNFLRKKHHPCLTCGHPICSKHQSKTFSTSNIRICQSCAHLFELDFLVDVITTTASNATECRQKVNEMVDCYDRAMILLLFTAQYTDEIATALEHSEERSNKVGLGSSATSMASGVAGVVGCGALLFPPVAAVGVPILISSLVFGGAATAAQTGDAVRSQYFSAPNKLADKMVTLHSMMLSLLRISEVLSYGLLKEHADLDAADDDDRRQALRDEIEALFEKHGVTTKKGVKGLGAAVVGGAVAAEVAAAGAEISATSIATTSATVAGRSSRFFGRVGTTAAASARFIPIAGGLLSAACVVVEGKELKKTVEKINEGNPCAKAEQIRAIRDELDKFPDSSLIAGECQRVFQSAENECAFF